MDWNDLRFLIAVGEAGSIEGAARKLDVAPHVVASRITALEKALNCELVTRTAAGATMTASGQRALAVARDVAAKISALSTELGGEHGELTGKVCVTSTAGFIGRAMRVFETLHEQYPALQINAMVSSHVVDLRRKDADIAVRMFRDQQDDFTLHKLGTIGWSLYASERYLADHKPGASLVEGHTFIGYDGGFSNTSGGRWIAANVPGDAIGMHVGGIRQALDAAARHHGVCIVPCYLTGDHKLVRVTDQVVTTNDVYSVYLTERASEARLGLISDALADLFVREQAMFAGT